MQVVALTHFLLSYLHPDWDLDYADEQDAIADFMASEPESSVLVAEIDALLAQHPTQAELYNLFVADIRSTYFPDEAEITAAGWLAWVRSIALLRTQSGSS
jgi:hypothetical protein